MDRRHAANRRSALVTRHSSILRRHAGSPTGRILYSPARFAAVARVAGPGAIVIQFSVSAVVITSASPESRARVAAREASGIGGAALGGWGGAWAGCAGLATLASPSLVLPIVGKVTTGSACLVGGIAGGFGAGWLGYVLGQWAGEASHDFVTEWLWLRQ